MDSSDQMKKKKKPLLHSPDLEKEQDQYQTAIKICARHMHACGTD